MKTNVLRAAPGLAFSLIAGACVFESAVPLAPPSGAEQAAPPVGVYLVLPDDPDDEGTGGDFVRIRAFNEREFLITVTEGSRSTDMRGFMTSVKGVPFMNMQELGTEGGESEPRPFMFARVGWDGDVLEVRTLSNVSRESFTSSSALRAWLESRLDDPDIYDKALRLRRIPPGAHR